MFSRNTLRKCVTSEHGFTLLEVLVALTIILVVSSMALVQTRSALDSANADSGLQTLLSTMRNAHQSAVDQRRQYRVTLIGPSSFTTEHLELVSGWVLQDTTQLPGAMQFTLINGMPSGAANTPDNMGTGAAAIDFSVDNGGGQSQIYFYPDGRALDSVGRINNGVAYIAAPGRLSSSRAVSMYGTTGRMKSWQILIGKLSNSWVAR
jgi:prepilin-type N-terminal cleavage/methylation domain-containing protein